MKGGDQYSLTDPTAVIQTTQVWSNFILLYYPIPALVKLNNLMMWSPGWIHVLSSSSQK